MSQLTKFWQYASALKALQRKGWKGLGLKRVESVADHSFGLGLLSLFEAKRRGYDVGVVLTLALIHDLEETITGDLTPLDKMTEGFARVKRKREAAVRKILRSLPIEARPSYRRLWMDLQLRRTREARLVHQLDKLEMAFQARVYSKELGRKRVAGFYESARGEVSDERLRRELDGVTGRLG